jgi:hypothetical protein
LLTDHQHYEELCALIVSGQASSAELQAYTEHAETCAECRRQRSDFAGIAQHLEMSSSGQAPKHDPPTGMAERFVARARAEGVPLTPYASLKPKLRQWPFRRALPLAAMFVLAASTLSISFFKIKSHYVASNGSTSPVGPPSLPLSLTADNPALLREQMGLSKQLRDAQVEANRLKGALEGQRKERESAEAKAAALNQQIAILQNQVDEARRNESKRSQEIARLEGQLKTASSERDDYRLDALVQKTDVLAARSKLELVSRQLEEAQQLSGAADVAKDLIVARNLHIVDVHDNENGSKPRPFGRIFYAEGKKLVFFAYDLGDPQKLSAKVSFYVWGEKAGAKEVKNLGIFRADDRQDGRWVLTFDDPRVLAQINTIFVTSELGSRKITKPNGNRILTAFLDDAPNHP